MKNIANTVFDFIVAQEAAAAAGGQLFGCEILPSLQHPVKGAKTIRVDNVDSSVPMPVGSGEIRRFNAAVAVEILVRPTGSALENLLEARDTATAIVDELVTAMYEDRRLGSTDGAVCDFVIAGVRDFWGNIQTKKYALSYIFLTINKR